MTEPLLTMAPRRSPAARVAGLVALVHPFPAVMNALAAAVFYVFASAGWAAAGTARIFLSVLLVHAAIGSFNDWCDRDLDRRTRPEKPLVAGTVGPRTALAAAAVSAVLGLLLSASFGLGAAAVALLVLAAGAAYDLRMKGTVLSWMPYAVAIPALPVWSFAAAGRADAVLLMSFPLGALLAIGLNLANTLPDLAGDIAHGVRGLAHRLGEEMAVRATWGAFAASIVVIGIASLALGNDRRILLPGLAAATLLLAVMILDRRLHRSPASLRRGWHLSAVLAAVLGVAWVASLPVR